MTFYAGTVEGRKGSSGVQISIERLHVRRNVASWVWVIAAFGSVGLAAVAVALDANGSGAQCDLGLACSLSALFAIVAPAAIVLRDWNARRIRRYDDAQALLSELYESRSSARILSIFDELQRLSSEPTVLHMLRPHRKRMLIHLDEIEDAEARERRAAEVRKLCEKAKAELATKIEALRDANPFIRAQRTLFDTIVSLQVQKNAAERQVQSRIDASFLKWRLELMRPDFTPVEARIDELKSALLKLEATPQFRQSEQSMAALADQVENRTREIEREALAAIPQSRGEDFDSTQVVQGALFVSALSIPVSGWSDITRAGDIYASLREVNGNYAGMSDFDIWIDTLMMPADQLAGLVSLTKGAYFEKLVEADFGGVRFEHFNHPDTDILIDGVAYQIKATDSLDYIDTVADGIPIISTSEIADAASAIDGGYSNEWLTDAVGQALGGPLIDVGDAALDAVFSGLGFISIMGAVRGVRRGAATYRETGDALAGLAEGAETAVAESFWSFLASVELATKGGKVTAGAIAKAYGAVRQWAEGPALNVRGQG